MAHFHTPAQTVDATWLLSVLKQAAVLNQPQSDALPLAQQPAQPQVHLDLHRFGPQAESPLNDASPPLSPYPCADVGSKRSFCHVAQDNASPAPHHTRCLFPQQAASPHDTWHHQVTDSHVAPSLPSLQGSVGLTSRGSKLSLNSLDDVTRPHHRSQTISSKRQESTLLKALFAQKLQQQQQQAPELQQHPLNTHLAEVLRSTMLTRLHADVAPVSPLAAPKRADIKGLLAAFLQSHSHGRGQQGTSAHQGCDRRSAAVQQEQSRKAEAELQQLRQIQNLMWDLQCLHSQSADVASADVQGADVAFLNSPAMSSCSGTGNGSKKRRMSVESEVESGLVLDLNLDPSFL